MKKRFILFLVAVLTGAAKVSAQEPYLVYDNDEKTLTFYYDDQKAERYGLALANFYGDDYENKSQVKIVVFDASFAQFHGLTNTNYWFHMWPRLTEVKGTENVNTENVTEMISMFQGCQRLESLDLSTWNTSNVETFEGLFWGCNKLKSVNLSGWNTGKVTNMLGVFCQCHELESVDVAGWDVRKVQFFSFLFDDCQMLKEIDISGWNTESVESGSYFKMFGDCPELTTIYVGDGWTAEKFADAWQMFGGSEKLVGGQGTTFTGEDTDGIYARVDGGAEAPGYLTYKKYTGIQSVKASCSTVDKTVYSLDGKHLKAPRKGINIIGGRKVVVK